MTATNLGRLFDYDNVLGAHIIRTSDGRNVAGLDVRNPAFTDYHERDRIAAELVRRWNAFEEGGAVRRLTEELRATVDVYDNPKAERNTLLAGLVDVARVILSDPALAALVEPGAGREPQG